MKFRFPIVIIDEDFRSEKHSSGLGIRALADAMEKKVWKFWALPAMVTFRSSITTVSRFGFILSIDDEEFGEGTDEESDFGTEAFARIRRRNLYKTQTSRFTCMVKHGLHAIFE